MRSATVTIEYFEHEITGTVKFGGPMSEVGSVEIDHHDADNDWITDHMAAIKDELIEAAYEVIEAQQDKSEALDYYDDEESAEGYESDIDAVWGSDDDDEEEEDYSEWSDEDDDNW